MRINDIINESAKEDLELLSQMADIVLSHLPKTIPKDDVVELYLKNSTSVDNITKDHSSKYSQYYEQLLNNAIYMFVNDSEIFGTNNAGTYNFTGTKHQIIINLTVFTNSYDKIEKDEIINIKNDKLAVKTVKAALIHEMRHAIQYTEYQDFYDYSEGTYPYDVDPVEIDAAWMHHLQDYNVEEYDDAKTFVNDVIKSFSKYKYLTKKQKEHYRRKTARYFYDYNKEERDEESLDQRYERYINNLISDKDKIVSIFSSKDKIDLRNYDNYENETNFLFPSSNFQKALSLSFNNSSETNKDNIYYLYAYLSLIYDHYQFKPSNIEKYYKKMFGITHRDAISYIDNNGIGKFDKQFFIDKIKKVFG